MGFVTTNTLPLLKEHARRPFSGHVLCLGQPRVHFSRGHLSVLAGIAGVTLPNGLSDVSGHASIDSDDCPLSGEEMLSDLGFEQVSSLDCSIYEGASVCFDLNSAELPADLRSRYDVVIDHGTIEHIFNVPNVMRNIYSLLKTGGRVFHSSPGSNFFDHGFYSFSPTFFFDFYTTNRWQIGLIQVYQMDRSEDSPPFYADYRPGLFAGMSYGRMGDKMYGTICIATKQENSTGDTWPYQSRYVAEPGWLGGFGGSLQQ